MAHASAQATVVRDDAASSRPPLMRPRSRPRRTVAELMDAFGGERVDVTGCATEATVLTGIAAASLDLAPGDLFVAMPGATSHGARFARAARTAGAHAIVTDAVGAEAASQSGLPTIVLDRLPTKLAALSGWMYPTSHRSPQLFGVTGTNGKTSTIYMIHAVLAAMGVTAGLSSTVERRVGDRAVLSRLTTPEAPELRALLAAMHEDGARAVAVEVSAHGVSRGRVDGVQFDVVGFTNLSHDHLDEYPTMGDYFAAKAELFTPDHARRGVVSLDTAFGRRLARVARVPVTTLSSRPDVVGEWNVRVTEEGVSSTGFALTAPDGAVLHTRVSLMGRHMVADAALAIVMLVQAGYDFATLSAAIGSRGLRVHVPGRSERISGDHGPLVLLDFSHNGAAFESTLRAVRRVASGKLIMIVGADGDRDPSKRHDMGRLGAEFSDILFVTDHHPRHESPDAIRSALIGGATSVENGARTLEVADPAEAIRAAIACAGVDDAILWAGPGLTDYRVIGSDRVPYSARHDARAALREAGWA